MLQITPTTARRLAINKQRLAGPQPDAGKEGMLSVMRSLGCVQLDPINVVARNPLLVLWSRLGGYELATLEALLWRDKMLFEYWAHAASIVLTDDFPLYQPRMVHFASGEGRWQKRVQDWFKANQSLRQYVLDEMEHRGPLYIDQLDFQGEVVDWESTGWTHSRNLPMMLTFLWERGEIMVTNRQGAGFGLRKQWGLAVDHLPQWNDHEAWTPAEVTYHAAQRALRSLGIGTAGQITNHFIRGRYDGLEGTLRRLLQEQLIMPVQLSESGQTWPGEWYIHAEDIPLLDQLQGGSWQPRTTLLSPFDNLHCDRTRAEQLFDFSYRSEIYVPKAKRQYGYYVMPILHGDRLVGRLDPKLDRKKKLLLINAVHWEPSTTMTAELINGLRSAVEGLAQFLGARDIAYESPLK